MFKFLVPAVAGALVLSAGVAFASEFEVDSAHSEVGFSVKHMAISTVKGHFDKFSGTFNFDPETGKLGNTKFEVEAASIETGNAKRNDHLKSPDFFDVAKFPKITVTNSKITKTGKNTYDWNADLNMHGVTKPVKFEVTYNGSVKGMDGKMHGAFTAKSQIKRSDWGLKWNKALEAGSLMVSEEVALNVEIEAMQN